MKSERAWHVLRVTVIGADALAIAVAFGLAWAITSHLRDGNTLAAITLTRLVHLGIYIAGWMLLLAAYHLYDSEALLDGFAQYERIAQASTTGLLLLVGVLAVLEGDTLLPRSLLLLSWLLSVLVLGASRFVMRRFVWRLRRRGLFRARTLIVGAGEDGIAVAEQLGSYAPGGAEVVGFLDEYAAPGTLIQGYEVLGEPLELARIARQTVATEAVLVPQAISWESLQVLLQRESASWGLQHMWLAPAIRDLLTTGMDVHRRGSLPLLSIEGLRIGGLEGALKRTLDIGITLLLLPVVLPVGLVIALWLAAVRRVRPIVPTEVIGRGRRRFMLLTFPPLPLLRQLHLWRLPALFNVVRGDVSLVGPRPIQTALESRYRRWQSILACVRPGLTGPWWLLNGTRRLSIDTEVVVDLSYIRHYSIWSDLHILGMTVQLLWERRQGQASEPVAEAQAGASGPAAEVTSSTRAPAPGGAGAGAGGGVK